MTSPLRIRIILSGIIAVTYMMLAIGAHAQAVNDHAVVHSEQSGQIVRDAANGTCVRTQWNDSYDDCRASITQTTIQQQIQHTVISQEERTVYFPFNIASLSPEAMNRLDTLANDIRSQQDIKGARIVGFADRIGTSSYNEMLSKKRAETVKNYLVAKGIVNTSIADTRWFGASMPATNCPNDLPRSDLISCLQKDRRVEVEIDYASEVVANQQ